MTVRNIRSSDIARCLEIYNYYIEKTTVSFEEKPLSLGDFTERVKKIAENYPFIVADDGEKTVGYAYLDRFHERSAYRYTADLSIYLDRDCIAKGTGGMLLDEIERRGKSMGIKNVISLITEENALSVAFHEKHGFRPVGRLEKVGVKFGRSLDVLYYQKSL